MGISCTKSPPAAAPIRVHSARSVVPLTLCPVPALALDPLPPRLTLIHTMAILVKTLVPFIPPPCPSFTEL
uniref:Uncharacterized protein n=1 Tax=Physcomitrium patens TaxID=3218 RepID=A0A2K1KFK7_PHYPA|nr:hypothetical protein PHYPA_008917 [Physcomitrium patens]